MQSTAQQRQNQIRHAKKNGTKKHHDYVVSVLLGVFFNCKRSDNVKESSNTYDQLLCVQILFAVYFDCVLFIECIFDALFVLFLGHSKYLTLYFAYAAVRCSFYVLFWYILRMRVCLVGFMFFFCCCVCFLDWTFSTITMNLMNIYFYVQLRWLYTIYTNKQDYILQKSERSQKIQKISLMTMQVVSIQVERGSIPIESQLKCYC